MLRDGNLDGSSDPYHFCYYIERPPPPEQVITLRGACRNCALMAITQARIEPGRLVAHGPSLVGQVPLINEIHAKAAAWLKALDEPTARGLRVLLATTPPIPVSPLGYLSATTSSWEDTEEMIREQIEQYPGRYEWEA